MWDYKVIAGRYSLDGADVMVENPLGKGTLQRILDHYGAEGFELSSTHYDNINRELVLLLKRPRGGVAAVVPAVQAHVPTVPGAAPAAATAPKAAGSGGGRRRSKADLDRLYRDA